MEGDVVLHTFSLVGGLHSATIVGNVQMYYAPAIPLSFVKDSIVVKLKFWLNTECLSARSLH